LGVVQLRGQRRQAPRQFLVAWELARGQQIVVLFRAERADGQRVLAEFLEDGWIVPRPQPGAVVGVDGPDLPL
jgi:hypothetical protein